MQLQRTVTFLAALQRSSWIDWGCRFAAQEKDAISVRPLWAVHVGRGEIVWQDRCDAANGSKEPVANLAGGASNGCNVRRSARRVLKPCARPDDKTSIALNPMLTVAA